jgi:peptidoglycan/xylan/chitin deacetylase (PgdA/CDA1 family)
VAGSLKKKGSHVLRSAYRAARTTANGLANRIDHPVVVLMYHCVTSLDADPHQLAVSPDNFRAQMEVVKRSFPVVRFEEEWSDLSGPSVAVTFDDGYANNLHEALPILEDIGVAATFFLSTGAIESGEGFWWDELDVLVLARAHTPPGFEFKENGVHRRWPTETPEQRETLRADLILLLKKLDVGPRQRCMERLREWSGACPELQPAHRPMTVDEVTILAANPLVTIGAHGVTHTALSALTRVRQSEELIESKRKLELWLEREVPVYAYPYGGRPHYTRESMQLCRETGFRKAAAANFPGQAHRWTRRFEVPRQMVFDWSAEELASRLPALFTA